MHALAVFVARLTLGALLVSGLSGQSDGDPVTIGSWRVVESKVLGEPRRLMVSLPPGHEEGKDKAPVLYVLDARSQFEHTVALVRFQQRMGHLPPLIVVGVANTDRTRDLTPPTEAPEWRGKGGGVERFLQFLREEVCPLVERDYRASPHRTLVGHSFGGLCALHAMVHHPDDFEQYLAISPSLWWNGQALVAEAKQAFAGDRWQQKRVYVTLGTEGGNMRGGYLRLHALLCEAAPRGLAYDTRLFEDENHGSVPYRSSLHGLRFLFEPWSPDGLAMQFLSGGWPAVQARVARAGERYGAPSRFGGRSLIALTEELRRIGTLANVLELLETAPEDVDVPAAGYDQVGSLALAAGDKEMARRAFTAALRLDPGSVDFRGRLKELGVDPDTVVPRVEMTAEQLRAFVGTYVEGDKDVVTLSLRDGKLHAKFAGSFDGDLSPTGELTFQMFGGFVRFEFRRGDDGEVTAAKLVKPEGEAELTLRR